MIFICIVSVFNAIASVTLATLLVRHVIDTRILRYVFSRSVGLSRWRKLCDVIATRGR